jgi:hypothetical protein
MKSLALVLGVAAALAPSFLAEGFSLGLLVFGVYLFSPWALLAFGASSLGTVARGVAVLVVTGLTVYMYGLIWTSDSSTAPLGFVWLPIYQWLAIGVIFALQRFTAAGRRRWTGTHQGESIS